MAQTSQSEQTGLEQTTGVEATNSASPREQLAAALRLLDNVHSQIRVADDKVRVLFSGSALLVAALALSSPDAWRRALDSALTPLAVAELATRVLLFVVITAVIACAILALLPRVRLAHSERSLFFFEHVAGTDHDQFIDEFLALRDETMLRQVLSQVHVNSLIASTKYRWTRRAASLFMSAVLLMVVVQIIALLSGGSLSGA